MIKKALSTKKTSFKDSILSETTQLLSTTLASLKEGLGEKKFEKRIKKAAKVMLEGFKNTPVKKAPAKKKCC